MSEKWRLLVQAARAMMADRQAATFARFCIDFSAQYEWNLDRAQIIFSRHKVPIVRADLQFVGTVSRSKGTWQWGWANESIPRLATERLLEVRRYGEEQSFDKLVLPECAVEGGEGHDIMLVAASILNSEACFHDHYRDLALFFILDGFVEQIRGQEP